jgi:hypothetical protein
LQEVEGEGHQDPIIPKAEAGIRNKAAIEPECEIKRVPLDPRVPNKIVMIAQELIPEEEIELFSFLGKNSDVFTRKPCNLMGVSSSIIEHKLHVNLSEKTRKQKLHKM